MFRERVIDMLCAAVDGADNVSKIYLPYVRMCKFKNIVFDEITTVPYCSGKVNSSHYSGRWFRSSQVQHRQGGSFSCFWMGRGNSIEHQPHHLCIQHIKFLPSTGVRAPGQTLQIHNVVFKYSRSVPYCSGK